MTRRRPDLHEREPRLLHDRRRLPAAAATSSRTSRSRRSATSRTRGCSRRGARRAATGSSARTTSSGCETILRLQRDEFLPLRVIRQELAAPARDGAQAPPAGRRSASDEDELDLDELCERAGHRRATRPRARGVRAARAARRAAARSAIRETDADDRARLRASSRATAIAPRHLRAFRTAADREAALLEQIVAPGAALAQPRAPPGRRSTTSQALGELAQELSQLLFWRALRAIVASSVTRGRPRARRSATSRTSRSRASSSRTSCRCSPTRRRSHETVERLAEWAEPRRARPRARRRGARLHPRRRARLPARLRLRRRAQARASCPGDTVSAKYALEYGFDALELHADAIARGQRVLDPRRRARDRRHGEATVELVEQLGGEVVGAAVHHRARRSSTAASSSTATTSSR